MTYLKHLPYVVRAEREYNFVGGELLSVPGYEGGVRERDLRLRVRHRAGQGTLEITPF